MMFEAVQPYLLEAFAIGLIVVGLPAITVAGNYARKWLRDKAGVQGLIVAEIGERLMKQMLRDSIMHTEEYAHALKKEGASGTPAKTKLKRAADIAFESIKNSKLPTLARDKVEELVITELGLMRARGTLMRKEEQ